MSLSPDQNPYVEGQEQTKQRVLIVEDNPQNTDVARRFFSGREGVVVDFAPDRKTAQDLLEKGKFNTLISDLNMPDVTGTGNKETGIESTFDIMRQFQKKLQDGEERYKPEDSNEFTRDEFNELLQAEKEIHRAYEAHKMDDEIAQRVADYELGGGEGTYLAEALTDDSRLERLGLSDRTEHFSKINDKVSDKFGAFSWAVVEAASSLASPNEANQPLGWSIDGYAKDRNMKRLILSSEEHSGYGSGIQSMLIMIFERGKGSALVSVRDSDDPRQRITENTKFVIGDKRKPEVWQKATSSLLENKK